MDQNNNRAQFMNDLGAALKGMDEARGTRSRILTKEEFEAKLREGGGGEAIDNPLGFLAQVLGRMDSIHLVTPTEFAALPDGTELLSITGERKIKGKDKISLDTMGGKLAYGLAEETGR